MALKGRKRLFIYMSIAFMLTHITANAYTVGTSGIFTYHEYADYVTIWMCSSSASGVVTVPSAINGKPVTRIESPAFYYRTSITEIVLPETITSIGGDAFDNCSLRTITIPNGVTSIPGTAFYQCRSLTNIVLHSGITTIGNSAFYQCDSLENFTIPSNVTSIGFRAFYNCTALTELNIPEGVTSIEGSTFYGCRSLSSLSVPQSVTNIGGYAFYGCKLLPTIVIPEGVTRIYAHTFEGCSALTDVDFPSTLTMIDNAAFKGCASLQSIIIPESVTSIGNNAFYNCNSSTALEFPSTLTSIGDSVFRGCSSLAEIILPEELTSIGPDAFLGCSSLTNITIPTGVSSIGGSAFQQCSKLKNASFRGNAPMSFGTYVFYMAGSGFKITYLDGTVGFTSPKWNGYPAQIDWFTVYGISANSDLKRDLCNDGTDILMDYAFNLNPYLYTSNKPPHVTVTPTEFEIRYYAAAPGITYTVETCDHLEAGIWTTNAVSSGITNEVLISELDSENNRTAIVNADSNSRFLRLKVEM